MTLSNGNELNSTNTNTIEPASLATIFKPDLTPSHVLQRYHRIRSHLEGSRLELPRNNNAISPGYFTYTIDGATKSNSSNSSVSDHTSTIEGTVYDIGP